MRNKSKDGRYKKHIMEKRYNMCNANQTFLLNQEVMLLTRKSARLSIVLGTNYAMVNVYCKTTTSKVYEACEEFGFERV